MALGVDTEVSRGSSARRVWARTEGRRAASRRARLPAGVFVRRARFPEDSYSGGGNEHRSRRTTRCGAPGAPEVALKGFPPHGGPAVGHGEVGLAWRWGRPGRRRGPGGRSQASRVRPLQSPLPCGRRRDRRCRRAEAEGRPARGRRGCGAGGLHHRADRVQRRVETHGLGLRGLQARVVHGVLERRLPVAAFVPGVAVVLDLRPRPAREAGDTVRA